jgi:hypothetical protein
MEKNDHVASNKRKQNKQNKPGEMGKQQPRSTGGKSGAPLTTFLERVFAIYDTDGEGHISRDELKDWYVAVEKWWLTQQRVEQEKQRGEQSGEQSGEQRGEQSTSSKQYTTAFSTPLLFGHDDTEHSMVFQEGSIGLMLVSPAKDDDGY